LSYLTRDYKQKEARDITIQRDLFIKKLDITRL